MQWFGCDASKVMRGNIAPVTRLEYDGLAQSDSPAPGTAVTMKYQIAADGFVLKAGQLDLVIPCPKGGGDPGEDRRKLHRKNPGKVAPCRGGTTANLRRRTPAAGLRPALAF